MLPKELEEIFEKFYDDDLAVWITKAELLNGDLIMDVSVESRTYQEELFQTWTITCPQHKKNRLSFDLGYSIVIKDDHPLLWHFTDTQSELYFAGHCKDVPKLFYDLYHAHQETFGTYECFTMEAIEGWGYRNAMQYGSGFLTKGSRKLMKIYSECLVQNGIDYSLVGEWHPTWFDGQHYVPESKDLKALFLGDTYVIARDFSFQRKS